jgi:hypothetical protein
MKQKIKVGFLLLLVLLFTSCSSGIEEPGIKPPDWIIGTWSDSSSRSQGFGSDYKTVGDVTFSEDDITIEEGIHLQNDSLKDNIEEYIPDSVTSTITNRSFTVRVYYSGNYDEYAFKKTDDSSLNFDYGKYHVSNNSLLTFLNSIVLTRKN